MSHQYFSPTTLMTLAKRIKMKYVGQNLAKIIIGINWNFIRTLGKKILVLILVV